ncbi:MAG: rhomboid family intramembrane serine protease [Deltaproteobacteria bacterium]|nr:rhomboid family intramembrane serine protease [Deltaproteobacteria bacterium]MBW2363130.1 rhomboid family intramembrane serine protease [Deltaproteobacteria bacterium]
MPWRQLGEPWRSLPLVTLGLAVLWLVFATVIELGFARSLRDADHRLRTAARFALEHPEVQVGPRVLPVAKVLMPLFESNEVFSFLRRRGVEPGGTQDQFDELSTTALAAADAHPYRSLGLVPSAPRPMAFLTHGLVHSGVRHVLANLLLLLLAGPTLERLWGRWIFGAALVGWGLASGGLFAVLHAGSEGALLGGSTLVTGCVAALLTRMAREEIDFLAWLRPFGEIQLSAPAWALGVLWAVGTGFAAWSIPGAFPGIDNAVGWTAQACAAALGAGAALAVWKLGWEERFGTPPQRLVQAPVSETFQLAKVKAQYASGERDTALAMLQRRVEASPGHRDAVVQFFAWAVEESEPERAAPAMLALMRHELRRGADAVALAQWVELADQVLEPAVDAETLLQLVVVAQREGQDETLLVLLQRLIDAAPEVSVVARAARLAVDVSPELASSAARIALSDTALDAGTRMELEALVERLAPGARGGLARDRERKPDRECAPAAHVLAEESDRSAFGAVEDLSALDEFPRGLLSEAVPLAVVDGALRVEVSGRGVLDVSFARVCAVAMAGVHGLGAKPVVLIDLLLDGSGCERPLSVLRLRSDGFDPRQLLDEGPRDPLAALRGFVARLLAESGGAALPDPESAAGQPVKVYASLDEYHEQVLQPAALQLD